MAFLADRSDCNQQSQERLKKTKKPKKIRALDKQLNWNQRHQVATIHLKLLKKWFTKQQVKYLTMNHLQSRLMTTYLLSNYKLSKNSF